MLGSPDAGRELDSDLATALHIQTQGRDVGPGKAPRPVSLVVERKCSYRHISSSHWQFNIQHPGKGPWLCSLQRGNEMPALLLNNALISSQIRLSSVRATVRQGQQVQVRPWDMGRERGGCRLSR